MTTIGILTSGGDAPGMNACIAAVAEHAEMHGAHIRGIFRGFRGLIEANSIPIGTELSGLARRGGTFLGTSRNDGELEESLIKIGAVNALRGCGVDSLIVLGGGGSLSSAARLAGAGAAIVGVPCTVDNDVYGTEYSLGFDTAVSKGMIVADDMMDTAESLGERIFMLETLGAQTGHIALATAYAVGADAVFVHEVKTDIKAVANKIRTKMDKGGTHGLIVLCEGLGTAEIAQELESLTGRRTRLTVLGHGQRGGSPTYLDRTLAREFAEAAVEMIISGESGRMITHYCGKTSSVALSEVAEKPRAIDMKKYESVNRF